MTGIRESFQHIAGHTLMKSFISDVQLALSHPNEPERLRGSGQDRRRNEEFIYTKHIILKRLAIYTF